MAIVKVDNKTYTADPLYQWDKNQVLEIRGLSLAAIPEVHFANGAMDRAIVRQAKMDAAGIITADIPNSLLQKPYKIFVYVCTYTGATFETEYRLEIEVKPRVRPGDYTLENDEEVYSFNAIENQVANMLIQVNAATATAKAAATTANGIAATAPAANDTAKAAAATASNAAKVEKHNATLTAAGWVESDDAYTQDVVIPSILETDNPHVTPDYPMDETLTELKEAWASVSAAWSFTGKITFICFDGVPDVDIPVRIEVHR